MNRMLKAWAIACMCALVLQGCGGGGGGGEGLSITQPPASQTTADGATATFTVTAADASGYRWQRSDDGGNTWVDIPNATSAHLDISADYAHRDTQYRVVVTGAGATVTSGAVTLNITAAAPHFDQQPVSQSVLVGYSTAFFVVVHGTQPQLRWQSSIDGTTWTDVPGATDPTLNVAQPDTRQNGTQCRAVASNAAGELASNAATLTVLPSALSPVFITEPVNMTVTAGGTGRFDARTLAEASGETMQWQSSGDHGATWIDLPGPQFAHLTLPGVTAVDDGKQFRRLAGNAHDQAISAVATLSVGATGRDLSILAGRIGGMGNLDGVGAETRLDIPGWPSVDAQGNIYVGGFTALRKVDASGRLSTFAGDPLNQLGGRGFADAATGSGGAIDLGLTRGTAVTSDGTIYTADGYFNTIRKVSPDGTASVFAGTPDTTGGSADGNGAAARFLHPSGLALDAHGNLYVADTDNYTLRKITPAGAVTTLAGRAGVPGSGGGSGTDARFTAPRGIAVDTGGTVYVTDTFNHTVSTISPSGTVAVLAGSAGQPGATDGLGAAARFDAPTGITVDGAGNVYVADVDNQAIRRITPNGQLQTLAGGYGLGVFESPVGVAMGADGALVVTDAYTLQRVSLAGVVTPLVGLPGHAGSVDGTGSAARFQAPSGLARDGAGNIYVAQPANGVVRKVSSTGVVTTIPVGTPPSTPANIAVDAAGNLVVVGECAVQRITPGVSTTLVAGIPGTCGNADGNGTAARFNSLTGVAIDAAGNIFVSDVNGLHEITPAGDVRLLVSGGGGISVDGPLAQAKISIAPTLAFDPSGNLLMAAWNSVRKITPDGVVSTLSGSASGAYGGSSDGPANQARFGNLSGIAVDAAGNAWVSDAGSSTIRRIAPDGTATTVLGVSGTAGVVLGANPLINMPSGVVVIDSHHLAVMSENALLVFTMP